MHGDVDNTGNDQPTNDEGYFKVKSDEVERHRMRNFLTTKKLR